MSFGERRQVRAGSASDRDRVRHRLGEARARRMDNHPAFGFNYDPSHWATRASIMSEFIREFPDRIYPRAHQGRRLVRSTAEAGGDPRRPPQLRRSASVLGLPPPGPRIGVNFEEIIRALNYVKYEGPLSVEWEDTDGPRARRRARPAPSPSALTSSPVRFKSTRSLRRSRFTTRFA